MPYPLITTSNAFRSHNQYAAILWWSCKHLETFAVDLLREGVENFAWLLVFVTSPNNSFLRLHTQKIEAHAYIFCYKRTHLKPQKKFYHDSCKPYTKTWWQPQKKNYTCKRRIHNFYEFCIEECKAIFITFILASSTTNCCCCCCCCIMMSRYIYHLHKIRADFYF